jgi:hypothetical protein
MQFFLAKSSSIHQFLCILNRERRGEKGGRGGGVECDRGNHGVQKVDPYPYPFHRSIEGVRVGVEQG